MIILASGSPRRIELLASLGLDFSVHPAEVDETVDSATPPDEAVLELSRRKARHVYAMAALPEDTVIAADTLVWQDTPLLGKPADAADAAAMLRRLSGRRHTVYTGLTVIRGGAEQSGVSAAFVTFRPMTEREIEWYVATGEPLDKAGAYGIQERGGIFVERIEGDFFTVLGLPLCELFRILGTEIL